jgi:thiamine kinase-like enzyme
MSIPTSLPWADLGRDLDADMLRQALQQAWPACAQGGHVIEQLRVLKSRRSSSRQRHPHPVTLCMDLAIRRRDGSRVLQQVYGKAYRDGASAHALPDERSAARAQPAFGEAVSHVPGLDMLLWAWPNDPALHQLPTLLGPAVLAHLPAPVCQHGATLISSEVLRYEPECRATLRLDIRLPHKAEPRVLFAKTFCDDRAATLHQRFAHFWHCAAADPTAPLVAEPLGYDEPTRTLWQAPARGVPLSTLLDSDAAPRHLHAVGRALARLHAAELPTLSQRPLDHWLTEIGRRRKKIARTAPELADRVQAVHDQLLRAAERLPAHAGSLIHGDFHADQIWIDGGRVVLFDFDEFSLGHPMEDLAEFCVKLEQLLPSAERAERLRAALLDGYRSAAPTRWCATALAWHAAVQSLVQASRAFVLQLPDWQREMATRLARTEQRMQETHS